MRYVSLAVAFGLLVIGIYAYTAFAAQNQALGVEVAAYQYENARAVELRAKTTEQMIDAGRATYAAKLAQIQQAKDQEAVARYGVWGPDIVAAAEKYGQDPDLLYRIMICESGGDPNADNGICKGLFQFNPGTWAGTPFGAENIFDGHAQIQAAAWMFSQGRIGEWVCQ